MFISPEESIGLPSINFVDGMVAGCVYLGADENTYKLFGMEDGVHYLKYEKNDLESLIQTVRFYQNHPYLLKHISENGRELAMNIFSEEKIMEKFSRVIFGG
jgi:glycosyltransferase involved in cell wall biosynthesis